MKTKITLSLFAMLITTLLGAQNVPNGGFEDWVDGDPVDWTTSILGTITQTELSHSGSFAVKGQTDPAETIIPELLSGYDNLGIPISENYEQLSFFYKYIEDGSDKMIIVVIIADEDYVTLGTGVLEIEDAEETFTLAVVPIEYSATGTAAHAIIQILLVDGFGSGPPSVDSHFIIDDVELSGGTTGVDDISKEEIAFTVSPQPADNRAKISINTQKSFSVLSFELFDLTGKKVADYRFEGIDLGNNDRFIDVSNLNNGMYILKSEEGSLSTRIIVTH